MLKKNVVGYFIQGLKIMIMLIVAGILSSPLYVLTYFAAKSMMGSLMLIAGLIHLFVGLIVVGWVYQNWFKNFISRRGF